MISFFFAAAEEAFDLALMRIAALDPVLWAPLAALLVVAAVVLITDRLATLALWWAGRVAVRTRATPYPDGRVASGGRR